MDNKQTTQSETLLTKESLLFHGAETPAQWTLRFSLLLVYGSLYRTAQFDEETMKFNGVVLMSDLQCCQSRPKNDTTPFRETVMRVGFPVLDRRCRFPPFCTQETSDQSHHWVGTSAAKNRFGGGQKDEMNE